MKPPEVLAPEKRSQILEGAARVFAEDGYEGASMARIAAVAGVSKGTLYNHFESKADLFSRYVEGTCERNLRQMFSLEAERGDPEAMLRAIGERMVALMLSEAGRTIYRVVVAEAAKFPALARHFYEAGPVRAMAHLADLLAAETKAGRLAVPDPDFAAEQFFGLCQTRVVMRSKLMLELEPEPADVARVVEGAVAMFLAAYAPQAGAVRRAGRSRTAGTARG
jgi:AcrR family transcriptional regulator